MTQSKRFLALILAALTVMTAAVAVSARSYDDVKDDTSYAEQIDVLSDIGVIKGTTETEFSPDNNVTREQMALLLFRLMLGKSDAGSVNTSAFTDLYDDTYSGAISWANSSGYILGTSASTFSPKNGITLQDAMTMIVRALGQSNDRMNAGYPWTYIDAAIKLGLDKNLGSIAYTETLTRAETAAILYNALTAKYLIPHTLSNGTVVYEESTVIEEIFGYEMDSATLSATNGFALEGSAVVKNGYVCLKTENGRQLTVKMSELGITDADKALGHTFRIVYNLNDNGTIDILSATQTSTAATFTDVKFDDKKTKVTVDGTVYTVVSEYSDILSTNDNELLVYAYENAAKLTKIDSVSEMSDALGLYELELIYGEGRDTASAAIIKNYKLGTLDLSDTGKINLADNKTADELTGGFNNKADAENGDFVLYFYNAAAKRLDIDYIPSIDEGVVTRLTASSVKLGDTSYTLGNANAGITAESIKNALKVGTNAAVVTHNGAVIKVINAAVTSEASKYLVATSGATLVYTEGSFRYVATALVNGKEQTIVLADNAIVSGEVYRYTVNNNIFTLIAISDTDGKIDAGSDKFVQNNSTLSEIAAVIGSASNTSVVNSGAYYTIENGDASAMTSANAWTDFRFVTNSDTLIIVGSQVKHGVYNSTITVNDGAKVVAVMANEPGSVETLRFLYVSDGALGEYDAAADNVNVLKFNGYVYENGKTYAEYTVFSFTTADTTVMLSENGSLVSGKTYKTSIDGFITSSESNAVLGFVSGYTSGTVTVGGSTYKVASDVKVVSHNANLDAADKKLADAYMNHVTFMLVENEVKAIRIVSAAQFTVKTSDNTATVTPDFDVNEFDAASLKVVKVTVGTLADKAENYSATANENGDIVIANDAIELLVNGDYTVSFNLGAKTFTVSFTVNNTAE